MSDHDSLDYIVPALLGVLAGALIGWAWCIVR